jgi:DNA-binding transcriptional LysR family regulator
MLDLALLHTFVSVVDAGSFTRAAERVHRTQSTVSQQIRRLEESVGRPLLLRNGKHAIPTEAGERLLSYSRRILALAEETYHSISQPESGGTVRLGIPEDFAVSRLAGLLSRFARSRPDLRLDVRCDLSANLLCDLERGEFDLALLKREASRSPAVAVWPEKLHWVSSGSHPIDQRDDPVPLAVFPQGCLYRNRAIHALEAAGRGWRIAYTCPNFSGIQAAVSAGLGVSILPETAILTDRNLRIADEGFPPIKDTQLALVVAPDASGTIQQLAELIAAFCGARRQKQ